MLLGYLMLVHMTFSLEGAKGFINATAFRGLNTLFVPEFLCYFYELDLLHLVFNYCLI